MSTNKCKLPVKTKNGSSTLMRQMFDLIWRVIVLSVGKLKKISLQQNGQKKMILQAFYRKNPKDTGKCHTGSKQNHSFEELLHVCEKEGRQVFTKVSP